MQVQYSTVLYSTVLYLGDYDSIVATVLVRYLPTVQFCTVRVVVATVQHCTCTVLVLCCTITGQYLYE